MRKRTKPKVCGINGIIRIISEIENRKTEKLNETGFFEDKINKSLEQQENVRIQT